VVVNFRSRTEDAKEAVAEIEALGGEAIVAQADVAHSAQVEEMFALAEDAFGPVSVLVNNAGIRKDGLALRTSDSDWNDVLSTNLFGAFACSRRVLKGMVRQRWGRIINISSVAGVRGIPGQANYCAAKAGLIGLTKAMAIELAARDITVNAVTPGLIATELTTSLDARRYSELESAIPMRRAGRPEEVAALVAFLASDEASYISGSVLTADGAMTA
jgi:3-oxoacyl-[acyl-carrier protein] reductase